MSNSIPQTNGEIIQLRDKIVSELEPFLDKLRMGPMDSIHGFEDSYRKFMARIEDANSKINFLMIGQTVEEISGSSISKQVFDLFFYLGLVESYGNCFVDLLVMLLIANGKDFHIESLHSSPRIKHVNSMNDLEKEKVPLTTKLNFLRDNGIDTFSSIIDSRLRNDIAHLNFKINENTIIIRGKPTSDLIRSSFDKLMTATTSVSMSLHKLSADLHWED
jgi:hypothetical protein